MRIKNENGKKTLENLSMYNAIARPLQKVGYCGAAATVVILLIGLRFLGSNSYSHIKKNYFNITEYFFNYTNLTTVIVVI